MESRQLRHFVEVAVQKSFTKAAKQLHIAQPAVSKSVKNLEDEIGIPLFAREERTIQLTEEGKRLFAHATSILNQMEQAVLEMEELKGLKTGRVRIGLPSMVGSFYFPEQFVAFKKKYPQLELSIYEAGTTRIRDDIREGNIDLGTIVMDDATEDLITHPFLREEMMVVVPDSHPFASLSSISYDQLLTEPLVLFKEGYYQRNIIHKIEQATGRSPHIAFETNQISMAKSLTRKGLGITIFLKMVISEDSDLVGIPFETPFSLTLALSHRKGTYLSKANKAFLSFLVNQHVNH
ncbi:LysR family transcriptional regulator [Thalassorhabdus alkalitolerans]|uniref:LysR family transcriptional regulator n=1 Tax=Thalassorhabdus alkalitolerans TaxID=2282697 RepID=A0ABW0YLR9_9BACI